MSLRLLLTVCLCSYGYGYHSKRQLGTYHWYDQVVLPSANSVHQQIVHQLPERTAVVFTPQYPGLENDRRSEPEQVSTDYRLPRIYPVLIHFLSPEPLEQSQNLETRYHLTMEPVPEYQMHDIEINKYTEQPRTGSQGNNKTQSLQFGSKVTTTSKPSYSSHDQKSSFKARTSNAK